MGGGVRPDARVPQRDLLLDEVAMTRQLARIMGADGPVAIDRCERVRAKYQVGRSLRVLYALTTRGERRLVSCRTFPRERGAEVHSRAASSARPSGPLRAVAHDQDLGAVFFAFPNDRKLDGLEALGGRLVAYAPEKCATARIPDGFAKTYAGDEGARTFAVHRSLHEPASAAEAPRGRRASSDWASHSVAYTGSRHRTRCGSTGSIPTASRPRRARSPASARIARRRCAPLSTG
jgi:hypothetical protein